MHAGHTPSLEASLHEVSRWGRWLWYWGLIMILPEVPQKMSDKNLCLHVIEIPPQAGPEVKHRVCHSMCSQTLDQTRMFGRWCCQCLTCSRCWTCQDQTQEDQASTEDQSVDLPGNNKFVCLFFWSFSYNWYYHSRSLGYNKRVSRYLPIFGACSSTVGKRS